MTRACRDVLQQDVALICRVCSPTASRLISVAQSQNRPYSIEVVGDPYDAFSPGAISHPLRAYFRQYWRRELRYHCQHAAAIAYVTKSALQERYPPGRLAFHTHYSSIELENEAYVSESRKFSKGVEPFRLITVASLEHTQKGIDIILDALADCVNTGLNLQLTVVGDGRFRQQYEEQTKKLNLSNCVTFTGELPGGTAVRDQLDSAELFVLPSRQEGLPRSVLEAMSRALPCIASTVGGIPEILAPSEMVEPNNAGQLAEKLKGLAGNSKRLTELSARNLEIARQYHNSILTKRRNEFYQTVKEITHSEKRSVAA
jgi:glycosyltransferase involved in cell wall biosynthesis